MRDIQSNITPRAKPKGTPEGKGLYWVNPSKRGGMDGVFQGLAGVLQGISPGKSPGAALPSQGKHPPSQLFYSDLHSILNRFPPHSKIATKC